MHIMHRKQDKWCRLMITGATAVGLSRDSAGNMRVLTITRGVWQYYALDLDTLTLSAEDSRPPDQPTPPPSRVIGQTISGGLSLQGGADEQRGIEGPRPYAVPRAASQVEKRDAMIDGKKETMRIKVVGDGTIGETYIVDTETGRVLENVDAMTWTLGPATNDDPHPVARATLQMREIAIDLEMEASVDRNEALQEKGTENGI